jgi:hypothetical protein
VKEEVVLQMWRYPRSIDCRYCRYTALYCTVHVVY